MTTSPLPAARIGSLHCAQARAAGGVAPGVGIEPSAVATITGTNLAGATKVQIGTNRSR